ncbi:hypothetical protein [Pseudomonas oryzihabitans]|jgi:hypothetical protein|uniref:hypothetical protein n=1 Tax=Pseudomonas oryzihabitans TaxID=47885 RepID=UPI00164367A6|nr:hypothetical protein [Pseudomonas psychrotolerans]
MNDQIKENPDDLDIDPDIAPDPEEPVGEDPDDRPLEERLPQKNPRNPEYS